MVPQKRKGCGAHHQTGQELFRAALRFARVPQKQRNRVAVPSGEELGIQADPAAFCMYQRQK